ncbi:hypothetical protein EV384_3972 [Micromonospora kangleipakensis]|uniref:Glyoxalase-like domain-containing protein n=1 Tax=Micromonospora kangleipakensis TaxID=1077942 RepID=A0A4Q8BDM8_9ACTN|nr:hypothetical protein EV384_3972 [Micromonospora kangleipakensis]
MAIARFPSIVIDCPDPGALAKFYGAMLDWKVDVSSDWAEVRAEYGQCISFQQVDGYTPPVWPTQELPQQMHLDVIVDDLDAAEAAVLDLGATKHPHAARYLLPGLPRPGRSPLLPLRELIRTGGSILNHKKPWTARVGFALIGMSVRWRRRLAATA